MRLLMCMIITCLTACNRHGELPRQLYVDPSLKPYVQMFMSEADNQGMSLHIDNLIVIFVDLNSATIEAQCESFNNGTVGTPTISVLRSKWDRKSEISKQMIMFHELGHCVLFRQHNNAYTQYGYVYSIMYYMLQSDTAYVRNWTHYMYELFHY